MTDPQPGTRLGAYEIVARLGQGGMGTVYSARDTRLNRLVAIKLLAESFQSRFQREAQAIAALNHPNICTLYDIGPDYLVMEYVEGRPLQGPLAPEDAVRLAGEIASALEAAHERGILHRDLKPANILVTKAGAKLLDFGLAKPMAEQEQDVTQTRDGAIVGTIAYMSPEQAQGQKLDARSDIFSFGATLYELVSGRHAFDGGSMAEVLSAVMRDDPPPLQPPLGALIAKCLAKRAEARYQTMSEVRAALAALDSPQVSALPETTVIPRPPAVPSTSLSSGGPPSIAVLPFANMSRDADDEYFSDGLSEEIINALTEVAGLKVIARTSAFAFKGRNEDIRRIAESLGVSNVLEGSVRRAGPRLRITAQLIHAADGMHLWSQKFDRESMDIFAVQDEIAAAVASALRVKLAPVASDMRRHEPNMAAHEAYLKFLNKFRMHEPDKFSETEQLLREAIALDPEWAEPHAVLAEQYLTIAMLGIRPLSEAIPLARTAARRALELRPGDPSAHAVLGGIAAVHDYDWQRAAEEFREALRSESVPPAVHNTYSAYYLLPLGRFEEALAECDTAIALDPLNGWWRAMKLNASMCAGRYDETIAEARQMLASGRGGHLQHLVIAVAQFSLGRPKEALEAAEEGFRLAPWHSGLAAVLAGLLAARGDAERASTIVAGMRGGLASGMILYHRIRNEIDSALDWYERDVEQRQPMAARFAAADFYGPLRSHARWPRVAATMNLPTVRL